MIRFVLRRLVLIPFALVLVNFIGYAFAHLTFQLQQSQTVYGSGKEGFTPVWPEYIHYAKLAIQGDFGTMPVGLNQSIGEAVLHASVASLGLILIAFLLSTVAGLVLGLAAVRVDPPRSLHWLTVISTAGLAMPSFYIGILFVGGILALASRAKVDTILPVAGYGWDAHLILPVMALVIRPAMQIARVTSSLLASELGKRYVTAARSFGHTWHAIRWDKALRNVLAPIFLTIAGSFRLLMAELLLVEWLFSWPGLGRLLVQTLVPPNLASIGGLLDTSAFFLNPPLVASVLVVFAFLFLLMDTLATMLARLIDPRLEIVEEVMHD